MNKAVKNHVMLPTYSHALYIGFIMAIASIIHGRISATNTVNNFFAFIERCM